MIDDLLMEIIQREGIKDTNNPNDSGGRTKYGISEKYHPEAWAKGSPTLEQAKDIYFNLYVVKPNLHRIQPEWLMAQVVDFGVHSGPATAIKHLQKILNVKDDGIFGSQTEDALKTQNPSSINNRLVKSRVLMMSRLVQKRPKDLEFIFGWHNRALSFLRE